MSFYKDHYHDCFVECACHTNEHLVRFSYWDGGERLNEDLPEMYVHVQLYQHRSFFRRLWEGIKYVLNVRPHYGHWDETLISTYDAKKLRDYLGRFIKDEEAYFERLRQDKDKAPSANG